MTTYEPADWRPEPGERAVIMTPVGGERQAMRLGLGGWVDTDNLMWSGPGVTHARKLEVVDPASVVTLDPDNPDDVQRLSVALAKYDDDESAYSVTADNVLRSLLPTPPLPEPNGLGAVVVDSVGEAWVRIAGAETLDAWRRAGSLATGRFSWENLRSGKRTVKAHGVGCSCGAPDCNGGAS